MKKIARSFCGIDKMCNGVLPFLSGAYKSGLFVVFKNSRSLSAPSYVRCVILSPKNVSPSFEKMSFV